MSILIKNGTVVFPDKAEKADILIEDDVIVKIAPKIASSKSDETQIIDAKGKHVLAGFIDMHCHLRDPGFTYKEDIRSGTAAAAAGGFVIVCCMPNTNPVLDNAGLIEYIYAEYTYRGGVTVLPIGAITKGQRGEELAEMGLMDAAGAVAFSDDGMPVENGNLMKKALEYADTLGLLLISHCEDRSIAGDGVANEGYHATVAGLKGISRAAEESMVARDIILAETVGARIHIAHVSTRGSVELVRQAKKRGVKVTCETCPHYFAATDKEILSYNTNAKINPPLREEDDRLAIIEGLKDGTIDVIATDHAPHHADEKNREFDYAPFGTSGFETAFAVSYTYLVKPGHITLSKLSELMSANPADILGFDGVISEGAIADITIADLKKVWTVDAQKFVSKGKNCVFDGWELMGEITDVVIDGEIVICE
ncbi:MAG: dihydroorotase [Firmicutes bacterium]|nr:dihydroorotase [Bacillota bacterium]